MNPYPLKWGFCISGDYSWFRAFAESFPNIDVGILIGEEDGMPPTYIWTSHHFRDLSDAQDVCVRGAALKALFDGALFATRGRSYTPMPLHELVDLKADQIVLNDTAREPIAEPFSSEWPQWRHNAMLMSMAMARAPARFLFLTRYDELARGMLQFLGTNGVTWISLYALKDFMTHSGWSEADIARGADDTKANVEMFRRTANNYSAIGRFARHGEQGWQPPTTPMTLDAAADLILKATVAFLNERAREMNLVAKARQQSE
jgi:hypothetical protein